MTSVTHVYISSSDCTAMSNELGNYMQEKCDTSIFYGANSLVCQGLLIIEDS